MPSNEGHIHISGIPTEVITYLEQDLLIEVSTTGPDPIGLVRIKEVGHVGTGLELPNSTSASPTWSAIPGTSPTLEALQQGYFGSGEILIRQAVASPTVGIPAGGTAGQVLTKDTNVDYDVSWVTPSAGGGGTTSGFVWDGATYALDAAHSLFIGPTIPPAPQQGDIWFNTANGTATVQGFSLATSLPATVTAGGVAHTKGPWTELVASTDTPMAEIVLLVQQATSLSGTGLRGTLADVGIGAAGAEVVVVSNLDIGRTSALQDYRLPLFVPAGSRIAVRTQSFTASLVLNMQLAASTAPTFAMFFGGSWIYAGTGATATTWGTSTANSLPQTLTLPAAINTWGAWTQFEASTAATLRYLLLLPSGPNVAGWSTAPSVLLDVGIGALGAEQSILDGGALAFSWNTTEAVARSPLLIGADIPAGSRLSVRYQASDITQAASASLVGFS